MVVISSIQISGGLPCKFVEMSKHLGTIEVLNPLGNPHWIISRGKRPLRNGNPKNDTSIPETSLWDERCSKCNLRQTVTKLGIHITNFSARDGNIQLETVATSDMQQRLLDGLKQWGCGYEILSATTLPRTNRIKRLTQNQLESLRIALREGFYEYPRKTDLRLLSEILDCSPSTLCETLRRGEKAILSKYVEEHERIVQAD